MSRYDKYFLRHLLWLQDSFCDYYVQSDWWGRPEILDVAYVIFDWEEDAEYWITQCAEWEPYDTISRLRTFLAADCLTQYQVHRMNDRQVMRTAARELCTNAHRMVIKPKIGWAVWVDPRTQKPVQPIAVEGAADIDGLLDELKIHLDAMVADRQRQTEQLNAKLAEMNAFEKSWELQKRTYKSAPQYLPLRNAVDALRALPDTVKTMGKLLATGGSILEAVSDAVRAGSMAPIQDEIKQAVAPLVETAEQAKQATAMVQVLLNDEETYDLLYDFGERYIKVMHPLDIAEYGLKAASVIVTLIASIAAMIYTGGAGGAGTAGKLLINIKRLREASPVIDKIYKALKCMAYRTKLPKLIEKGVSKLKRRRTKTKGKGGVPEVKAPDKIDKNRKKGYSGNDEGPKRTVNRTKQSQNSTAAAHLEEVSADPTNVSEASIKRALRKSGTPEALATSKLIKRGKVKVNIVDTDPFKMGAAGRGSFVPDKDVYIALDKVKNARSAAGITSHEAKHILQKVTPSTYRKVHEFEAYKWQREAGFLNMTDQEIIDLINSSHLYRHLPGTLP